MYASIIGDPYAGLGDFLSVAEHKAELKRHIVSYWGLNSGSLLNDSVGGVTLTNVGTVTARASDFKEGTACADYNGSEYLEASDAATAALEPNQNYSVSCWYNPGDVSIVNLIAGKDNFNIPTRGWNLFLQTVGGAHFGAMIGDNGSNALDLESPILINPVADTWYHICACHDFDNKRLSLYVNGANKINGIYAFTVVATSLSFRIGAFESGSAVPNDTQIDQFIFFNKTLSESEVRILHQYPEFFNE